MSNIYLKVTIEEKNWHSQNDFLSSSKLPQCQLSMKLSLNFKTPCSNLKIRGLGAKLCLFAFSIIFILKGIMTFKS